MFGVSWIYRLFVSFYSQRLSAAHTQALASYTASEQQRNEVRLCYLLCMSCLSVMHAMIPSFVDAHTQRTTALRFAHTTHMGASLFIVFSLRKGSIEWA